jgi:hypothetical protein
MGEAEPFANMVLGVSHALASHVETYTYLDHEEKLQDPGEGCVDVIAHELATGVRVSEEESGSGE